MKRTWPHATPQSTVLVLGCASYFWMHSHFANMASASHSSRSEKARVFRAYHNGEASEEEVREVFGDDFEQFTEFSDFMAVVEESTTNEATDDLFQ